VFVVALGDSSDRVRTAAVLALRERGDSDHLAEAVAELPAARGRARAIAVRALFELRKPGGSSKLAKALVHMQDSRPLSDEEAALVPALTRAEARPEAGREVVQELISALADERRIVAERAKALLVRLGPASVEELVRELAGGVVPHRAAAVLGELKNGRALQPLVAAVSHPDARVRSQACAALGELRDPAAVEPLLQATRDPEPRVRVLAGAALDGMGMAAVAVSVAAFLGEGFASVSPLETRSNGSSDHPVDELTPGRPAPEDAAEITTVNGHAPDPISLGDLSSGEWIDVGWESDVAEED
jgi:HEAT repeat protein